MNGGSKKIDRLISVRYQILGIVLNIKSSMTILKLSVNYFYSIKHDNPYKTIGLD